MANEAEERGGGVHVEKLGNCSMGHLCDNVFVLDTPMSDPVGHLLGYLTLAFNYCEGKIIIRYIFILIFN